MENNFFEDDTPEATGPVVVKEAKSVAKEELAIKSYVNPAIPQIPQTPQVLQQEDPADQEDEEDEEQWIAHSHKETASCVLPKLLSSDEKRMIDLFVRVFGQFDSKVTFTKVSGDISDILNAPSKRRKK